MQIAKFSVVPVWILSGFTMSLINCCVKTDSTDYVPEAIVIVNVSR